ncbi:uncharacterized protein LOC126560496 [Anopheles maculipalpis]|uniref:uncharacterized protein LOC126560496 n=1 Tax=Anopheles maculipalpis TaxID=1496333 RepID=UPI002159939B|nr:uncharacterized protein LOC126560496 [Anopheles maculipalpis]
MSEQERAALTNLADSCANEEQCYEKILAIVVKDAEPATACYRVLKLNSLPLFKTYLSSTGLDETALFQCMASAIISLSVRNVALSNELDLYVKWKLSDYGYRKLTGNWNCSAAAAGWKSHIGVISQCWDDIVKHKYNANDNVDDRFLHRVHTMHNHLYFIRLKTFLKHLPVMETLFCLAIFMNIHKNPAAYRPYRLLICKRFIVECLEAIVCQLKHMQAVLEQIELQLSNIVRPEAWANGELANGLATLKRDETIGKIESTLPCVVHPKNVCERIMAGMRRKTPIEAIVTSIVADETFHLPEDPTLHPGTLEAIRGCYSQMKLLYLMMKMHKHISYIAQTDLANQAHALPSLERSMMMVGEAFNELNKLDLPDSAVLLAGRFKKSSIFRRNFYTHSLAMFKKRPDEILLKYWSNYMHAIRLIVVLMLAVIAAEIRLTFYRKLHRCETLGTLRALLIYTGESDCFRESENEWYENVSNNPKQGRIRLEQMFANTTNSKHHILDETYENLVKFQGSAKEVLQKLKAIEGRFDYESVRKTCFASGDLFVIKNLLLWKLQEHILPKNSIKVKQIILELICNGEIIELPESTPFDFVDQQIFLNHFAPLGLQIMHYRESVVNFINKLNKGNRSVDDNGWNKLHDKLNPYYGNIFRLDKKWTVLKDFCTELEIRWDSKLASKLRQKDLLLLQALFDERRKRLRTLFEQCAIRTEDDLVHKLFEIPLHVRAAMEYIQGEMCKMLLTVKYFGDNFPALTHSLPMLQGKSYRNYLAHDGLSYDLVTSSGDEKCLINAFVFANRSVELFSVRSKVPTLNFPSFADAVLWIDQQQELRSAIESGDVQQAEAKLKAGAEIKGKYYCSLDVRYQPTKHHTLADLVEWSNQATAPVLALLSHYFPTFRADLHSVQRLISNALARRDFEAAYGLIFEKQELRKELLAWPSLPLKYAEVLITKEGWANVLKELFDCGNSPVALEVMKRHEHLLAARTDPTVALMNDLLQHAMFRDLPECRNALLSRMSCRLLPETLELAIAIHWADLMKYDAAKRVLDDALNCGTLLCAAVMVSNFQAMEYFLNRGHHKECYYAAVCYGTTPVLEHLLRHFPVEDDKLLSELLSAASGIKIWSCVRLLLEKDVCAGNALPILVRHGMVDLIRCIKRLDYVEFWNATSTHPFLIASKYDKLSDEMFDVIRSLGFCCFDNTEVLHEMVKQGRWSSICEDLTCQLSNRSPSLTVHCEQMMNVLSRWKKIALFEKPFEGKTTLSIVLEAPNTFETVSRVLELARDMRRLEDLVLSDIAIGKDTTIVRYGCERYGKVIVDSCNGIMQKIEGLRNAPGALQWQDFTMDIYKASVMKFSVLGATNGNLELLQTQLQISGSTLADKLLSFRTITDELFGKDSTVYATLATDSHTLVFFKIDEWCCVYDRYPLDSTVDLSSVVNATLLNRRTILQNAICHKCHLDVVKLLMKNGANLLLADDYRTLSDGNV